MAVTYHYFKDFDTTAAASERIRKTYEGPLSLAESCMAWNITKDNIHVRLAEVDHPAWGPPLAGPAKPPRVENKTAFAKKAGVDSLDYSTFVTNVAWDIDVVLRPACKEASKKNGHDIPYPGDQMV